MLNTDEWVIIANLSKDPLLMLRMASLCRASRSACKQIFWTFYDRFIKIDQSRGFYFQSYVELNINNKNSSFLHHIFTSYQRNPDTQIHYSAYFVGMFIGSGICKSSEYYVDRLWLEKLDMIKHRFSEMVLRMKLMHKKFSDDKSLVF